MVTVGWSLPLLISPLAGLAASFVAQRFEAHYRNTFLVVPVTEKGLMSLSAMADEQVPSFGSGSAIRTAVLMIFAALAIAAWAQAATPPTGLWLTCALGWSLMTLAAIDIRLFILPDVLTFGLTALGLGATLVFAPDRIDDHVIGAALGFILFALVRETYRRLRHRDGLGLGDAKLMGAIGAWLGWEALPSVVLIAAFGGLLGFAVTGLLRRSFNFNYPLPFGPFLALGAWVIWLHGEVALG